MAGFNRRIPNNPALRSFGGSLLPATLGETLEATFEDPRTSPTELLGTQYEIDQARGQRRGNFPGPPGQSITDPPAPDEDELSPVVPAEKLNERYKGIGLKFDKPTRSKVAEILAEQKREDLIRQDVLARGPQGVGATAAQLGASFAAAAIDPINVASAFVPVVSQARFAGWAAKLGTTRARLATGVAEGTVGNAAIEPLVYGLSQQQQLDYEMSDALINVGLGGFLGGGLHVAAGRMGDFIRSRRPETREAALRASVAQMAEGRSVDIEDVFVPDVRQQVERFIGPDIGGRSRFRVQAEGRIDPAAEGMFDLPEVARGDYERIDPLLDQVRRQATDRGRKRPESLAQFLVREGGLQDQGGELTVGLGLSSRQRPGLINNKSGLTLDEAASRATEQGFMGSQLGFGRQDAPGQERATVDELLSAVDEEVNRGRRRFRLADSGDPADDRLLAEVQEELDRAGADINRMTNDEIKDLLAFGPPGSPAARINYLKAMDRQYFAERAARETAPDRDMTADFDAAQRAQEAADQAERVSDMPLADAARAEADYAETLVNELRDQGLLSEADSRSIDELSDLTRRAEDYGRAARQAAVCMTRNA